MPRSHSAFRKRLASFWSRFSNTRCTTVVVLAEVDRIRRTSVELTEVDGILIGAGIHRRKLGALALEGGEHGARHLPGDQSSRR